MASSGVDLIGRAHVMNGLALAGAAGLSLGGATWLNRRHLVCPWRPDVVGLSRRLAVALARPWCPHSRPTSGGVRATFSQETGSFAARSLQRHATGGGHHGAG
jgi:hypothetical protein